MNRSRVVCVDDQMGIRSLLKEILEDDYNVRFAASGKEALTVLEGFNPHIVMLDMYLGDMKGIEVLSQIRKLNIDTKVIIMSGRIEKEIKAQLDILKPEFILKKPFDIFNLKSKLSNMMDESMKIKICS